MTVKEKPPSGLLDSFSAPLWVRLGLTAPRPVWIVKSQHRGYEWMAIELDHGGTGFQQTRATTTVFVVWLPARSAASREDSSQATEVGINTPD